MQGAGGRAVGGGDPLAWTAALPECTHPTPRGTGAGIGEEAGAGSLLLRLSGPQVRRPRGQAASPEGGPAEGVGSQG